MSSDKKLDQIIQDLDLIKNHLKIVPDRELAISDKKSSIEQYEKFAKEELKLNEKTITNQLSTLSRYLVHCKGVINKDTVRSYLDSNDSDSWKSNQLKTLRRYCRDFLQLGNWINEFKFSQISTKIKKIPTDEEFANFLEILPIQSRIISLVLYTSGLRISEVLSLRFKDIANEFNMIDVSEVHEGNTKHSWISFMTQQTVEYLYEYLNSIDFDYNDSSKLFSNSSRVVQNNFTQASQQLGIKITPHLLRTMFTEKCTQAKINEKYINAFCGRISKGVLAKHYTDYSPESLRREYDKIEDLLTLSFEI